MRRQLKGNRPRVKNTVLIIYKVLLGTVCIPAVATAGSFTNSNMQPIRYPQTDIGSRMESIEQFSDFQPGPIVRC